METDEAPDVQRRRLRQTLWRVLLVQVISMALLWLVHARYHGG
jgi:hypothetical protein